MREFNGCVVASVNRLLGFFGQSATPAAYFRNRPWIAALFNPILSLRDGAPRQASASHRETILRNTIVP